MQPRYLPICQIQDKAAKVATTVALALGEMVIRNKTIQHIEVPAEPVSNHLDLYLARTEESKGLLPVNCNQLSLPTPILEAVRGLQPLRSNQTSLLAPTKVAISHTQQPIQTTIGLTFAPLLSDPFNFYDGAMFDAASNSMTSGSDRMAQAREINANLPASIQNAFNDNSINYYYPGIGEFYYSKVCSDAGCSIIQVAISCNCYVDGADQQLHYLTINQEAELEVSTFRNDTRLPPATKYLVKPGDTLVDIAVRYGVELSLILAANPAISSPDLIFPAEVIHIPAQAYMVVKGDNLYKIANDHGVSLSVLEALNDQIDNPDLLFQGQIIKVPARKFGIPFCTTVEPGDSLFSISEKLSLTLSSIEVVNPQIKDKNLIFPTQIVNVSMYLPAQGNLTSDSYCPVCGDAQQNCTQIDWCQVCKCHGGSKGCSDHH